MARRRSYQINGMRTRVMESRFGPVPENRYGWPENLKPCRSGSASASSGCARRAAGASPISPSTAGLPRTRLSSWKAGARSPGSIRLRRSPDRSAKHSRSCCAGFEIVGTGGAGFRCRRTRKNTKQMGLWDNLPLRVFWQRRYYDFNVSRERIQIEKLRYMSPQPGEARLGGVAGAVAME